jgi:hypothetical protein
LEQDFYVGRLRDQHGLDVLARGIPLDCTEIDLLVGANDARVPVLDTPRLHAERAVELALDQVGTRTLDGRSRPRGRLPPPSAT